MSDPFAGTCLPVHPCIVIDQGSLRDEQCVAALFEHARDTSQLVMLTETLFQEMLKGDEWEKYYQISLANLMQHPELVVGARPIGELIEAEASGEENGTVIVNEQWTVLLRGHLLNLRSGPDRIIGLNRIFSRRLRDIMFNRPFYELNKQALVKMVTNSSRLLPADLVKKFRRGDREAVIEFMASDAIVGICASDLADQGLPKGRALMLALEPSASGYYFLTTLALALKWVAKGGIDTVDAEKLNNDSLDMEYVTIGLFCENLLSKDKGMMETYALLKEVVSRRWKVTKDRFAENNLL